ncbi:F-box protein [Hirschfeldia incana]|nr:F-box protein [Hirschfeldia incana]KAJ0229635.1 F-box protein [Hirschfeldia incana]
MGRVQIEVFAEFVERVLSLRKKNSSPMKKVSFKLSHLGSHERFVPMWVKKAMDLGALELCLSFGDLINPRFVLLYCALESKALVDLRIRGSVCLTQGSRFTSRPDSVSPVLNSLVLDSVQFTDDKPGFEAVLSAFPNLQNLRVHESNKWYYWDGSVSSPTLKRFVYRRGDDTSGPKRCVTFDTPGLFTWSILMWLLISMRICVWTAWLKLGLIDLQLNKNAQEGVAFVPGDVSTLFKGIRNVKILCLSPDALDTLYYRSGAIPVFNNLISLSMGSDRPHGGSPHIFWKLFPSLLLKAPNLQTLIIKGLGHCVRHLRLSWDDVSDALSSCGVKVLQITGYEGTGEELSHMKCFLGSLPRLEMVRVTHKGVDDGERRRLMDDFLCLPKASSKCKVKVMKESA